MLFRSISLPSISGHFRFGSIRFNALPPQLISLLGFAPAIRRCSLPTRFISSLSFSSAALFLSVPQPFHTIQFHCCSTPCYSPAPRFNAMLCPCNSYLRLTLPLQFDGLLFSALAFPYSTYLRFSMAYLSVAFPLHFLAPLFHFLAMLFRHISFQFYAYAIGLIAVPLRRFTIPMHCPAIQCRCHPMQFSSIAVRN